MDILFLGMDSGTAKTRCVALRALGHNVTSIDPYATLPDLRLLDTWNRRTGFLGSAILVRHRIMSAVKGKTFDVAFIDNGDILDKGSVQYLGSISKSVLNYNLDNPFTNRDGQRWRALRRALPYYSHFFTPRESSAEMARYYRVAHAHSVTQSVSDSARLFDPSSGAIGGEYKADVSFAGTWMPERGPFLLRLIEAGVPLKIIGPRWQKAPEHRKLKDHLVAGYVHHDDFMGVLASSRISICLLSKGNLDRHTTRSIEIPMAGSLLCAERTEHHEELYEEGVEAVFWSTAEECAEKCNALLADSEKLAAISHAGRQRALRNNHFDSVLLERMLARVMQSLPQ